MSLALLGFTIHTAGELLIGYTAIRVHFRFWKEHKVDEKLFSVMKKEQVLGFLGIALVIAGFAIEAFTRF